mmetsp:Transcript_48215/g.108587  ORF Transcript_48215/g.108587 Transcript_48215/m.108587 type:complete len:262 (-) Transcript_48215:533-1318(-)
MIAIDSAVRLSLTASLAYLSPDQLAAGRSEYSQRLRPHLQFAEQVTVDELSASCTLFTAGVQDESTAGDVVVAFRGSTAFRNYLSMFNLGLVPSRLGSGGGARVHRGYQEATMRLYEKLAPALERHASSANAGRLSFVGHSYGGGTATMSALLHHASGKQVSECVTFAGPRIGDTSFAAGFDEVLGASTTHLWHERDPVLAQNQPLWSMRHAFRTPGVQISLQTMAAHRLRAGVCHPIRCARLCAHGQACALLSGRAAAAK